ncbi:RCC1 and BTB domain-containing protein 1 [Balamuthia mandrillaris]
MSGGGGGRRRLTLVWLEPLDGPSEQQQSERRKLFVCPNTWAELQTKVEEIVPSLGTRSYHLCLSPEQGGGEVDDPDLLDNGDLLYVKLVTSPSSPSPSNEGKQHGSSGTPPIKEQQEEEEAETITESRADTRSKSQSSTTTTTKTTSMTSLLKNKPKDLSSADKLLDWVFEGASSMSESITNNDKEEEEALLTDEEVSDFSFSSTNNVSTKSPKTYSRMRADSRCSVIMPPKNLITAGESESEYNAMPASPSAAPSKASFSSVGVMEQQESEESALGGCSESKSQSESDTESERDDEGKHLSKELKALRKIARRRDTVAGATSARYSETERIVAKQLFRSTKSSSLAQLPSPAPKPSSAWARISRSTTSVIPSSSSSASSSSPLSSPLAALQQPQRPQAIRVAGIFCMSHQALVEKHLAYLAQDDITHAGLAEYVREATWHTNIHALDQMRSVKTFKGKDWTHISCGHNIIVGVKGGKRLVIVGPKELDPVVKGLNTSAPGDAELTAQELSIRHVDSGPLHSCAITTDGKVVSWGFNINCSLLGKRAKLNMSGKFQVSGQLGLGNPTLLKRGPSWVTGIEGVPIQASCGTAHTACLTSLGVYTWGCNDEGQLGYTPKADQSLRPRLIVFPSQSQICQISCGAHHTAAVSRDGNLFCWGYNKWRQLGIKTSSSVVAEPTFVPALNNVSMVSCGDKHTAAITTKGELYTWGGNDFCQLGQGRKPTKGPTKISLEGNKAWKLVYVECGQDNTAVISTGGIVWLAGKLCGEGMTTHSPFFRKLNDVKNSYISKISCGITHFALTEDVHYSAVLKMLLATSTQPDVPAGEDVSACFAAASPEAFVSIQHRAISTLTSEKSYRGPKVELDATLFQFSGPGANILTVTNNSKKSVNIRVSSPLMTLPAGCSVQATPQEITIKSKKTMELGIEMEGRPSASGLTVLALTAVSPKKHQCLRYFLVVLIKAGRH